MRMNREKSYIELYGNEEKLPWEMVLYNIPEPDPGKFDFRKSISKTPPKAFQETKILNKLIAHLDVKN